MKTIYRFIFMTIVMVTCLQGSDLEGNFNPYFPNHPFVRHFESKGESKGDEPFYGFYDERKRVLRLTSTYRTPLRGSFEYDDDQRKFFYIDETGKKIDFSLEINNLCEHHQSFLEFRRDRLKERLEELEAKFEKEKAALSDFKANRIAAEKAFMERYRGDDDEKKSACHVLKEIDHLNADLARATHTARLIELLNEELYKQSFKVESNLFKSYTYLQRLMHCLDQLKNPAKLKIKEYRFPNQNQMHPSGSIGDFMSLSLPLVKFIDNINDFLSWKSGSVHGELATYFNDTYNADLKTTKDPADLLFTVLSSVPSSSYAPPTRMFFDDEIFMGSYFDKFFTTAMEVLKPDMTDEQRVTLRQKTDEFMNFLELDGQLEILRDYHSDDGFTGNGFTGNGLIGRELEVKELTLKYLQRFIDWKREQLGLVDDENEEQEGSDQEFYDYYDNGDDEDEDEDEDEDDDESDEPLTSKAF